MIKSEERKCVGGIAEYESGITRIGRIMKKPVDSINRLKIGSAEKSF